MSIIKDMQANKCVYIRALRIKETVVGKNQKGIAYDNAIDIAKKTEDICDSWQPAKAEETALINPLHLHDSTAKSHRQLRFAQSSQ